MDTSLLIVTGLKNQKYPKRALENSFWGQTGNMTGTELPRKPHSEDGSLESCLPITPSWA